MLGTVAAADTVAAATDVLDTVAAADTVATATDVLGTAAAGLVDFFFSSAIVKLF